jgi:hypothetical protein
MRSALLLVKFVIMRWATLPSSPSIELAPTQRRARPLQSWWQTTLENLVSNGALYDPARARGLAAAAPGAAIDGDESAASSSFRDAAAGDAAAGDAAAGDAAASDAAAGDAAAGDAAAGDAAAGDAVAEMDCDPSGRGDDASSTSEEITAGGAVDGAGAGGASDGGAATEAAVIVQAPPLSKITLVPLRAVIQKLLRCGELAAGAPGTESKASAKAMRAAIRPFWLRAHLEGLGAEREPTTDLAKTCALLKRVATGDFSGVDDQGALAPLDEEEGDNGFTATAPAAAFPEAPSGYEFVDTPPAIGASPRRLFLLSLRRCGASCMPTTEQPPTARADV